jgi:hypothetical protein
MPSCDLDSTGIGLGPLEDAIEGGWTRSDAQLKNKAVKLGVRLVIDGRSDLAPARCTQTK